LDFGANSLTNTWLDDTQPCHIEDSNTGAGVSGQHDINVDFDHGPPSIVVQMMPFFDTPNPGGVYKAWIIPLERYIANAPYKGRFSVNHPLNVEPTDNPQNSGKGRDRVMIGYDRDSGFGPPRDQAKTDNFKVKEESTGVITVQKFHDLNADGIWDSGEPAIGPDGSLFQCISELGTLGVLHTAEEPCESTAGGWPVDVSETLPVVSNDYWTPVTIDSLAADTYTITEAGFAEWIVSAAYVDGDNQGATDSVSVTVSGLPNDNHSVVFGNFMLGSIWGVKYEDRDGDGVRDTGEPGIGGVTIELEDSDGIILSTITSADGTFHFEDLMPGSYTLRELLTGQWFASTPASRDIVVLSGAMDDYAFGNYLPADVQVEKSGNGPINAGDVATFTITLTNNGPGTAYGVTLEDTPEPHDWSLGGANAADCLPFDGVSLACDFGDVASGDTRTVTLSTTTDATDCGIISNTAVAPASLIDHVANNSSTATITVDCPDVTVLKTASAASVSAGDGIGFTILVSNAGPGDAYDVTLNDTIPSVDGGWTLGGADAADCVLLGNALSCDFGKLTDTAGDTRTVTLSATTSAADCDNPDLSHELDNEAIVGASNEPSGAPLPNSDDAQITIVCPDITVVKSASNLPILVGGTASFTIQVTNDGPGDATGVSLEDTLPGTGWDIDSQVGTNGTASIDVVGVDEVLTAGLIDLAVGQSFSVTVFRLTNLDDCGDINNTATVAGVNEPGGATGNNSDGATVAVDCPAGAGLTPGFWKNWDNHFTDEEFQKLLPTSVASTIEEVNEIFADYNNSAPVTGEMLEVFVLANELTINLTVYNFENDPDLPNPSGGSLYGAVVIVDGDEYNLGDALADANEYIEFGTIDGEVPTAEEITALKTILDTFANLNNS
jgi:uncharacterized repeat protein (TIGR01451 family)